MKEFRDFQGYLGILLEICTKLQLATSVTTVRNICWNRAIRARYLFHNKIYPTLHNMYSLLLYIYNQIAPSYSVYTCIITHCSSAQLYKNRIGIFKFSFSSSILSHTYGTCLRCLICFNCSQITLTLALNLLVLLSSVRSSKAAILFRTQTGRSTYQKEWKRKRESGLAAKQIFFLFHGISDRNQESLL